MTVKQNSVLIPLRTLMTRSDAWGRAEGRDVYLQLLSKVEEASAANVFKISLDQVVRTDASFASESVIEIARRFRCEKGFCLTNLTEPSLTDNWEAAACRSGQPLILWLPSDEYKILGPALSEGMKPLFEIVVSFDGVTTGEAADQLGQTVQNVSNKMRSLWEQGYVLRTAQTAPTGGIEFRYIVPK